MTTAGNDNNLVSSLIGVLNTDGETISLVKATAGTHILDIADGATGSDFGQDNAERDQNGEAVMLATSNADGTTPVPLYVDSSGCLLIKST